MNTMQDRLTEPFAARHANETFPHRTGDVPDLARQLVAGAVAGAAGTGLMTLAMEGYYRLLPSDERQPLEPSQILDRLQSLFIPERPEAQLALWPTRSSWLTSLRSARSTRAHAVLTLAAHFGYGIFGGVVYASTMHGLRLPLVARGIVFGLGLFAVSYLGWLPSLRVLQPVTTYTRRRQAGLVGAHLVYALTVAALADRLR